MKINVPKIIKPLPLGGYDKGLKHVKILVWVNPTRALRDESLNIQVTLSEALLDLDELQVSVSKNGGRPNKEQKAKITKMDKNLEVIMADQYAWWENVFSQHKDENTHWTPGSLKELDDQDTALWNWISMAAAEMIRANRERTKKN